MPKAEEGPPSFGGRLQDVTRARIQGMGRGLRKVGARIPRGEYFLWSLFVGLSCIFLWSAFSGPQGAMEFLKLRGSLKRLELQNETLLRENQALEKEVYLLRNSPSYLEKVAREEYGYAYDGEKVYLLPEEGASPATVSAGRATSSL